MRLHWLLPGNWSLEVNATDEAGNVVPTPETARWRVAFEPNIPYVRFTTGTLGVTNRNATQFQLTTLTVRAGTLLSFGLLQVVYKQRATKM